MIQIKRSPLTPSFEGLPVMRKIKNDLKKFYKKNKSTRRQLKPPYFTLPLSVMTKIRAYLFKEFNGKCAYCESAITVYNQGDFDHFRPTANARGLGKEFSLDHYWTLAFNHKNLYMSCDTCERYKLNWFPVEGKRAPLNWSYGKIIKSEKNMLVDPCNEDPETVFYYQENGLMKTWSRKGELTIEILKLNRKDLVDARRKVYHEIESSIQTVSKLAKRENDDTERTKKENNAIAFLSECLVQVSKSKSEKEYLGFNRYFLEKLLNENRKVIEFLLENDPAKVMRKSLIKLGITLHPAKKKTARKEASRPVSKALPHFIAKSNAILRRFSIESIEISNFKAIEKLEVKFPQSQNKKEPWLMLLGENAVGKSTFLQAVALTLMGEDYRKKLKIHPLSILRNGATSGYVKINQVDQAPVELHFTERKILSSLRTSSAYLLGYGSTRLFPSKNIKPERTKGHIRARNMFDPSASLFADNWLLSINQTNKMQFDFACRALKDLLAREIEDPDLTIGIANGEVVIFYSDKSRKPDKLRSLSDGYKSIIAIACDMMYSLLQGHSTMEVAEGIVLLDEIGTHLHPRWKMRVVNSFRHAFPKLQFIVTTHDPLCLKGLYAGEIIVLDKNQDNKVFAINNLPDPGEYRADQLLSSRFFGLNSTVDEDLQKDFDDYYHLLSRKDDLTAKENDSLKSLKEKLRDKKHLGSSLREELAFSAVDTLLSKELANESITPVVELKQQTVDLLQELWNKPLSDQENITKS